MSALRIFRNSLAALLAFQLTPQAGGLQLTPKAHAFDPFTIATGAQAVSGIMGGLDKIDELAAAGFADASISRSTNVLGNQTEERSIDTSGKKAIGSALSRTADRFSEKVRAAPEYSILEGPTTIQVLIIEQPRRNL